MKLPIVPRIKSVLDTILFAAQFIWLEGQTDWLGRAKDKATDEWMEIHRIKERVAELSKQHKEFDLELSNDEVSLLLLTCRIIDDEMPYQREDSKVFQRYLISHMEGMEDSEEQLSITDI
jgi:hypothetical protein